MATEPRWLSTAEAAKRLGITPRTLYRFIDEGQVPGYRFGRVIRLKEDEVDGFIEACRIKPGTLEHLYPEPVSDGTSGQHGVRIEPDAAKAGGAADRTEPEEA